jgi:hypothetical protein
LARFAHAIKSTTPTAPHQDEQRLSYIADRAIQLRPEIDTLLFLRPTESALVFLQHLGRGLRLADGKVCVTALDFIGEANRRFRFNARSSGVPNFGPRNYGT